jgi:endoribonuclease LACTB2
MGIITLAYDSTFYFLIDCKGGKLLVDAGMAGTLPKFQAELKRYRLDISTIRYVMLTHHHPDHAGILQEVKQLAKAKLIILEKQIPFLENLKAIYAKKGGYTPIRVESSDLVLSEDNRAVLQSIGVAGEILATPGHSPDCVSLLLDSGEAFIGDMNPYYFEDEQAEAESRASWQKLIARGAQTFYPAHGKPAGVEEVRQILGL